MVCSCKQCVAGVLSPRTAYRLEHTAQICRELIMETQEEVFRNHKVVHDPPVFLFEYMSPEFRLESVPQLARGYANCFATAAWALKQRQLPKPSLITQCASIVPGIDKEDSKYYFQTCGGYAEFCLDALLSRCTEEQESAGDGLFLSDEDSKAAYRALPACINDDNFDELRLELFQQSEFWPSGPYDMDGGGGGGGGAGAADDGWVHYDTSNWRPPENAADPK